MPAATAVTSRTVLTIVASGFLMALVLAILLETGECLSLGRRQDLAHLEEHHHPGLAETGTGLLEHIDLGHDARIVGLLVREERIELGPLPLHVRFEVDEALLMAGEDLLEVLHLRVAELELVPHLLPLPELTVVLAQRPRPVRLARGGCGRCDQCHHHRQQDAQRGLHARHPEAWTRGTGPGLTGALTGRSHRDPRPASSRLPSEAGRRRRLVRSGSYLRWRW